MSEPRVIRLVLTNPMSTTTKSASWTVSNPQIGTLRNGAKISLDYIIAEANGITSGTVLPFTIHGISTFEVNNVTNTAYTLSAWLLQDVDEVWQRLQGASYEATIHDLHMFQGSTITVSTVGPTVFQEVVLTIRE